MLTAPETGETKIKALGSDSWWHLVSAPKTLSFFLCSHLVKKSTITTKKQNILVRGQVSLRTLF